MGLEQNNRRNYKYVFPYVIVHDYYIPLQVEFESFCVQAMHVAAEFWSMDVLVDGDC
jgi:hypothetical protein